MQNRVAARVRIAVALTATVALAGPAWAQGARIETDLRGAGRNLGAFRVFPHLGVQNYYDDNIFASETAPVDDYIISINPGLGVESNWTRHYLSAAAAGRFNRYATVTSEDNDEYAIDLQGRFDLAEGSIGATFDQGRRTVARADSENTGQTEPEQLDYYDTALSYEYRFARFDLELLGFLDRLDFVEPQDADRDRIEYGGSLRLARRFSPALSVFLEPGVGLADYDQKIDNGGVERNEMMLVGLLGAEFDITSVIAGEIAIGPAHATFEEPTFSNQTTIAARGAVTWDLTRLTRLEVEVVNRFVPTDVAGASIKLRTQASLEVRHELLKNLFLRADAGYYREKFYELGRKDDNYSIRAGAEYNVNRFFSIFAGYGYRLRNSNFPTREFNRNVVTLTFNAHL